MTSQADWQKRVWITEAPTLISFTVKTSEPNVYEQKPIWIKSYTDCCKIFHILLLSSCIFLRNNLMLDTAENGSLD